MTDFSDEKRNHLSSCQVQDLKSKLVFEVSLKMNQTASSGLKIAGYIEKRKTPRLYTLIKKLEMLFK